MIACELLSGFRSFPYENASKLVAGRRRSPAEMIRDHREQGAGGTCFDLVNLFHRLALERGFEARLALADRSYGPDTHCAVIIGDELYDPGYLQFRPIPLRDTAYEMETDFNRLRVAPRGNGWDVSTVENGPPSPSHDRGIACGLRSASRATFRYHVKSGRVGEGEFVDAWEKSFEFEMMNHLVTIVARGDRLIYLRDGHYHEFSKSGRVKREVPIGMASELGLSPNLVARARAVLGR